MTVKQKLVKGLAGAGVASVLTVSLLAGQAAPAQAILPVVPIVIGAVGGTAATTAISGWALAGVAAINLAVVGIGLAIKDNGSVWLEEGVNFFEEMLKPEEEKITTPANTRPDVTSENDNSYIWQTSQLHIDNWTADKFNYYGTARNRVLINLTYGGTGLGATALRSAMVIETTCKRAAGLGGPIGEMKSEVTYYKGPTFQQGAGFNTGQVAAICTNGDFEMQTLRLRAPTTVEKKDPAKFALANDTYYSAYMWADQEIFWKAADYIPADPGYRATVECVSATGVKTTLSLDSGHTEDGKVAIPSCAAAGLGDVASSLSIDYIDGTHTITPGIKIRPAPDQYTECDPAFGNVCQLEIYIDGLPCTVGTVQCAGWVSQHLADPSRVKCFYGTREVSISNCGVLEGSYSYGGSPLTANNTDGDPNTWDDPRKVPGWSPQIGPNGEPTTAPGGDPTVQPNPNLNPDPNPNPSPSPSVSPDPNAPPSTTPMPITGTNPNVTPAESWSDCVGRMWTWNPMDWVAVPVGCTLTWAFVPNPAVLQAKGNDIMNRFNEIGIAAPVQALTGALDAIPAGGSGCMGPAMPVKISSFEQTIYPIAACTEPMSTVAMAANALGSVYLVLFGSVSVVRGVSNAFGFSFNLGKPSE